MNKYLFLSRFFLWEKYHVYAINGLTSRWQQTPCDSNKSTEEEERGQHALKHSG